MFEKEIKFIADYNLNKVKGYGSFITFDRLPGSSVHPAIIQYISAELEFLISEDRKRLLQDSVFDYSGQEVTKHWNLIAQEIKKNKQISFEDVKKLVIQAVSFNLNFLARPKWSLSKLIYNDELTKTVEEIKLNLNYIYFYDYIKSIFLSYINKRKLTTLSVTEFELILNKIDNELFSAQPQKLVDYSIYSMAEFFCMGDTVKSKISIYPVELFLKEKNLMEYLFRLKKVFPENTSQKYDIDDIKKVVYSPIPLELNALGPLEEPAVEENNLPDESIKNDVEPLLEIPAEVSEEKIEVIEDIPEIQVAETIIPEFPADEIIMPETPAEEPEPVEEPLEIKSEDVVEEKIELNEPEEISTETSDVENVKEEDAKEVVEEKPEEIKIETDEITEQAAEEIKEEIPGTEIPDIEIPGLEEFNLFEDKQEEKTEEKNNEETAENSTVIDEPKEEVKSEAPVENEAALEIPSESETMSNEDFFSLFSEEVKKIEEIDKDIKSVIDEPEPAKKEEVDSYFDFEEETENLLRAFKDTEDEINSKDAGLADDSPSYTEKAAMDLIRDFNDDDDDKKPAEAAPKFEDEENKSLKKNGKQKNRRKRDILDTISNNDIEKIIANVFSDDRRDFADTMEKLNECTNYDEATEILKGVFLTYRVNPYTKDALTLTNSVANYFSRE